MAVVVTYAEFTADARFREFKATPRENLEPCLLTAHRMWDEESAGAIWADLVKYQTAALMQAGIAGAPASKTRGDKPTGYQLVVDALARGMATGGVAVTLCD